MRWLAWTFLTLAVTAGAASAQTARQSPADVKYCDALIRLYRTYINDPTDSRQGQNAPSTVSENAIASCEAGNPAAGIPALEIALKNARFTLPPRG